MLGLFQKTRFSIAQVRTGIEVTVVILVDDRLCGAMGNEMGQAARN